MRPRFLAALLLLCVAAHVAAAPQPQTIVLASTTSTEESGLFRHLLPAFTRATGIQVKVVAVGTGQALDMARRGDADVVLVHDTAAEEKLVAEGWGLSRRPVMANDFVLVGPRDDPAGARGNDIARSLQRVARAGHGLVSRGDRSGTHAAELRYWSAAGVEPRGEWYRACGCGMGPALNMAAATGAYVLADRGTWLAFRNRGTLDILVQGDVRMSNPYGVMVVNPGRHPHVKVAQARAFADWITSADGQATIASFRIAGQPAFFPQAGGPSGQLDEARRARDAHGADKDKGS
jgi:tungstate transport system substrate-binding protein